MRCTTSAARETLYAIFEPGTKSMSTVSPRKNFGPAGKAFTSGTRLVVPRSSTGLTIELQSNCADDVRTPPGTNRSNVSVTTCPS